MTNPAFVLPDPILTPEAYLLLENDNKTGTRHEYVNGLIYAMTGRWWWKSFMSEINR